MESLEKFHWRFQISVLYDFDVNIKNSRVLCGIDEVGRGPLAGSVYAAAFIFPDFEIDGVNDSKKLSPKKRELIFEKMIDKNVNYSIGSSSVEEIDRLNILKATHLAMKRAVENLNIVPDLILVDGKFIPDFGIETKAIIKGDSVSYSIASASIIAKVLRDRLMVKMHEKFPDYSFDRNKGYGTKAHIEALKRVGPCEIHRKSFLKNII